MPGVDISRADQAKERIRRVASRTFTRGVLGGIGSFGAMFALDLKRWREPVLVSIADGVGTKLKVSAAAGVHSTVGADQVNHCVNDILTLGRRAAVLPRLPGHEPHGSRRRRAASWRA